MLLRLIRKEDEGIIVEHLRANISPMETAGSSLATTHRIIKALFDFYTQEGCNYFVIEDKLTNQILLGIGLSTFAGLPFEEKVAELRDFINPSNIDLKTISTFIQLAEKKALSLGYKKVYVKPTINQLPLRELYIALGFVEVEDQSSRADNENARKLLFKEL